MNLEKFKALTPDIVWQKIFKKAQIFPLGYDFIVLLFALLGFAYLLMFPVLLVVGAWQIAATPFQSHAPGAAAMYLVFWAGITALAGSVTVYMIKVRFRRIDGITINAHTTDKLHRLLDKISIQTNIPRIDHIIVTEKLSLDVVKTPVCALPVWSTNTLVIGLPLMQCLSPEYFECAVTRKLLQYSKQRHWFAKWLYQLRTTWALYLQALSANVTFNNFLLLLFFQFYAPFYRRISTPVAYRCELEADKDTLELVNDEDLLQTIETVIVTKIYLDQQYWPKVAKMLVDKTRYGIQPYTKLEDILKVGLTSKTSKRWLDTLYCHESPRINPVPGLRARMNNIGRSRIRIPEKINETAAHYYLDRNYASVVAGVNQLWQARHSQLATPVAPQNTNTTVVAEPPSTPAANHLSGNLFH
ncbi:MAG: hypothetical protein PVF34_14045 [Gammaproteobacteria bacterium]|jgi:hypothetical protein